MTVRALSIVALVALCAPAVGAQRGTAAPRFERVVKPAAPGPNRLAVDSTLLVGGSPFEIVSDPPRAARGAASIRNGLGELRLHDDARGREVQYLLVWPSEDAPRWRGGRIIPVSPGKDTSGFELDLGVIATVDRIDIPALPSRFVKRVRLEGSGDRVRWTLLVPDGTLANLPEEEGAMPVRQTQLAFAPARYRYLRLIADDHAGPRLLPPASARARIAPREAAVSDTMRQTLGFEKRPTAAHTSRYHIRLPAARLPILALELDVGDARVLRNGFVTEPRLGNGRVAPTQLGMAMLRRTSVNGVDAGALRIPIAPPTGAELDVVINDLDNPPLDIHGIRAIFTSLPYIYFESSNGTELRATYGSDRRAPIAPPQYDLEALRDTVKRIIASTATWGGGPTRVMQAAPPVESTSALYAAPGAPLDVKAFSVARAIPAGSGLTAVRLDPAALAHSRLDDVRIVDAQGRQVPYLLEQLDEPTEVVLPAPQAVSGRVNASQWYGAGAASASVYLLRLPHTGLPDASLRLTTSARVFSRDVGVIMREPRRDAVSDEGVDRAARAPWQHDDPDSPAPPLEIPLAGRLRTDSLYLLLNDGDNQKLPLTSAALLLPSYRLRFFREPGASLTLLYGRSDLPAPRYDIQLIAPRLLDAPAEEVSAEPEHTTRTTLGRTPQLVFWGVLGGVVVLLLLLIGRLVRREPAPVTDET